jgi:hypothetical protein
MVRTVVVVLVSVMVDSGVDEVLAGLPELVVMVGYGEPVLTEELPG